MNVVRGYRVMLNLSQQDLALHLEISRQAYSEKERGNMPFKDSEKIALRNLFRKIDDRVTIDQIFFNEK